MNICANSTISQKIEGNKCGHDTKNPKIYKSPHFLKRRPLLLSQAKHRANNVALGRSWNNPQYLKHYKEQRKLDISLRKQRSEARSRFSQFAGAALDHLDLETMQLGQWSVKTGMFTPCSWDEILKIIQINQSEKESYSKDRMYEEIERWTASGYLRTQKRHYKTGEKENNQLVIRQDVAHKWICIRALLELGFTKEQIKVARYKSKIRNSKIRLEAAVALCSNNPLAKAVHAVAEMERSAKNGTYSNIRKYFEQKKAEYKLKQAFKAPDNKSESFKEKESEEVRVEKIKYLVSSQGLTVTQAEKLIPK